MASTALEKAKKENEALRKRNADKAKKEKKAGHAILVESMGQLGEASTALVLGVVDAKFAEPDDMTHFGSTGVPVAPVIGAVLGLGSLALIKPAPAVASFVGRAGTFAVDLGIYFGTREKAESYFAG